MAKSISIIIPNLHSPIIDQTLASIQHQNYAPSQTEIIVVGKDRYGLVPQAPSVRFIDTGSPVAPAIARNLGLFQAKGEIVVFLDSDCIADRDWLKNLIAVYENTHYKVVGGSVSFENTNYWTLCDNISTFHPFLPFHPPGERSHLPSLNFSADRKALEAVGGFDERFPHAAGEDTDLSFRLRQAGHSLYFEPRAVVHHNPVRRSFTALIKHAWQFGRYTPRMRPEYRSYIHWPAILRHPLPLLLFSPVLAIAVTTGIFASHRELWRYWHTAPAIYLAKLAWCVGAAQQLHVRRGHSPPP